MRNLKEILSRVNSSADWIGLREVISKDTTMSAESGSFESSNTNISNGLMIEVLVDGQFGYVATNEKNPELILKMIDQAYEHAKLASRYKIHHFNQNVRPTTQGEFKNITQIPFHSWSKGEVANELINVTNNLKVNDKVLTSNAYIIISDRNQRYVTSSGTDITQSFSQIGTTLSTTVGEGSDTQTRSNGFEVFQGGFEYLKDEYFGSKAERITKEAFELLAAPECPDDNRDLILAPDQLYLQIHESIGHPLEYDRILGDERNYAGWSFVNPEDFNNLQYGSDILNVTFDPTLETELASYNFDDIGDTATKEYLIKDGKLLRGLGGLESQTRLGLLGVANMRASDWNRPATDRMANINIEPGESSLEDMISQVEKGVIMHTNKSWSIDDYRNKFQFGCEYGQLIENGKLTKVVKNPNYRGVTIPFWSNLAAVGNKDTYEISGSFFCGKAEPNQIIRVGHATPTCLFKNIDVFGGN